MNAIGEGVLRRRLEEARAAGFTMADATVLAVQNDPFRLDTPAGHRDAAWLADQMSRLGLTRRIHLRGLHYALVAAGDTVKPDGTTPYGNTDADWSWLAGPAKSARFLGYVPFERLFDARNSEPVIYRQGEPGRPGSHISIGFDVELPDPTNMAPEVWLYNFEARQPYHLVLFGEKTSLADVLGPIARDYQADLYLPSGEISDTLLYRMAQDGAEDGRPMRVFCIADCDPAGHQMPVSIGRKLQALCDLHFPNLDFEARPVALAVDQVRELDLPSTPLKDTERRAGRWREAFGVEQTEIDALATLRPAALHEIVTAALRPFYDASLRRRISNARHEWEAEAQASLEAQLDQGEIQALQTEAENTLTWMREELNALSERFQQAVNKRFDLPPIVVPEPVIDPSRHGKPLISSSWSWLAQTEALKKRKAYRE